MGAEYTKFYGQERKLTVEEKMLASQMLEVNAKPVAIAAKLMKDSSKIVLPKTIRNLKQVRFTSIR